MAGHLLQVVWRRGQDFVRDSPRLRLDGLICPRCLDLPPFLRAFWLVNAPAENGARHTVGDADTGRPDVGSKSGDGLGERAESGVRRGVGRSSLSAHRVGVGRDGRSVLMYCCTAAQEISTL